ncbi:MAG: ribosome-binding factor A, partial [Clostridia bacterium]|nr:ribosome-binding factor A [Clostridia bacterium]
EEETKRSFAALQAGAGHIRHELSQVMRMRTVPALTFRMDGSMVYGAKMDELFKKIQTPAKTDDEN